MTKMDPRTAEQAAKYQKRLVASREWAKTYYYRNIGKAHLTNLICGMRRGRIPKGETLSKKQGLDMDAIRSVWLTIVENKTTLSKRAMALHRYLFGEEWKSRAAIS